MDGPFRIGLNEVKIGLTVPWFAIELARQRLHPAHFDRTVVNATMYSPHDAVTGGFLDGPYPPANSRPPASRPLPSWPASMPPRTRPRSSAPAAPRPWRRARGAALKAVRAAIEAELTAGARMTA